ncbi:MAG: hypothetical protein EOO15_05675 [Chitinophagaceae bacterium]|nr:MAG: hypothetical protein EOO15_05675 [Chitinophagaceae bacterium]
MSSKQPPYLQLTRSNYEEAFLLYVDGELTPEAMDAVDAFTALHPDLREELDLLLETRLDAEPLSFGDLSPLQASSMQRSAHSEELLSYIDNELPAAQRARLDAALTADPALRSELHSLQAAKLPLETVTCPFKEELYRREEKRRPLFWLPRVAAAVVLLGAGTLLWQMKGRDSSTETTSSEGTLAVKQQPAIKATPVPAPVVEQITSKDPAPVTIASTATQKATQPVRISTDKAAAPAVAQQTTRATVKDRGALPQPAPQAPVQQQIAFEPDPRDRTPVVNGGTGDASAPNTTFTQPPVTSPALAALNPQSNDAQPVATEAVYREEHKQSSVRGFLRKASRFIEKRTGIKTTNEDNQLVVGGVAISLK